MSNLEVRDWINIIDNDISNIRNVKKMIMSMIGSSLIIMAVLIWFTYTNFIQNHNLDLILVIIFIQNIFFYLFLYAYISNGTTYYITVKRLKLKLPVIKDNMDFIKNKLRIYAVLIVTLIFGILNLSELLLIPNFLFYFITSSLIIFIFCIFLWLNFLLLNLMNPDDEIYKKLRYDILLGKITDEETIRHKYRLIYGKPSIILIENEKGKYEEY